MLKLEKIDLNYGSLCALKNISITFADSEIHAVVGEHGAGKTSLGLLINGDLSPSSGQIYMDKRQMLPSDGRSKRRRMGISMVYQDLALLPHLTAAENLIIGNQDGFLAILRPYFRNSVELAATRYFADIGLSLDATCLVRDLSLPMQALVAVLRAIHRHPRVLILDEVLDRLPAHARPTVLALLKDLCKAGAVVILITHRLDDIHEVADKVSIIRNGELLLTDQVGKIASINILRLAFGQFASDDSPLATNRREFYELLKFNEAILRRLPFNLLVTDRKRQVRLINDYAKEHFRVESEYNLSIPIRRILGNENSKIAREIYQILEQNRAQEIYNVPISISGKKTINNITVLPIVDGPEFVGSIVIMVDVTEQARMREQVMLSENLASVGLFAAGVAHEINNPLGTIYNYLGALKYSPNGVVKPQLLESIQEEFEYIASIVNNLVTFSDRKALNIEEVDPNELLTMLANLLRSTAHSRKIDIALEQCLQPVFLEVNRNELRQALMNLFRNSFEAMPRGGRIKIKTEIDPNRSELIIHFRDNGPGISPEVLPDVFLPFSSTKSNCNINHGLGLSITYGIVKKYSGNISVQNLLAGGCEFRIRFPLAPRDTSKP